MKRRNRARSKKNSQARADLCNKIIGYSAAAGAALAVETAQVEAIPVFTPVNQTIGIGGNIPLDFSNDSIVDLNFGVVSPLTGTSTIVTATLTTAGGTTTKTINNPHHHARRSRTSYWA